MGQSRKPFGKLRASLLNDGEKSYVYDQANRLVRVESPGLLWWVAYNGDGARLRQVTNGVPTTYTLDLAAGLVQVLAQQDTIGTTTYLYGVTRIGEQQPGGWAYHLSDALGSVRQLADGSAQVTLARGYMPYGEVLWSVGSGSSAYGYTGEDWNTVTQLVFLRARYYDGATGRFTQQDPSGRERNLYAYVASNPVNRTDPLGWQGEPPPYQCNWDGRINWYCKILNDPNTDPFILWQFYKEIASVGPVANPDYGYASRLLRHFLEGKGEAYDMGKDFVDNILLKDDTVRFNILHDRNQYLVETVKPLAESLPECTDKSAKFGPDSRKVSIEGVSTRPLFYARNAHQIDIQYEGSVIRDRYGRYEVELTRDFHAYDSYDWHGIGNGNLTADFETPFGTVTVPDEWAARVQRAGLGHEFDMYADWSAWAMMLITNNQWRLPLTTIETRLER